MNDDLEREVSEILNWNINVRIEKNKVPTRTDVTLGETAVIIKTCILFIDVRGSSIITNTHRKTTSVKIFNAFLNGVVRIAKSNQGHVRSFNGDSVLIIFDPNIDSNVSDKAVRTALKLQGFVRDILTSQLRRKGYEEKFEIGLGIAKDEVLVSKVGIRGTDNNDLIWLSTGTNKAAKMGNIGTDIHITDTVYKELSYDLRFSNKANPHKSIWNLETFEFAGSKESIYVSNWFISMK